TTAQSGELFQRSDRVLDELDVIGGERRQLEERGLEIPCTVGVEANLDARSARGSDRGDPVDGALVADLDLDGAAPRAQRERGGDGGCDPRNHRVDGDTIAGDRGKRQGRGLERRPRGRFALSVIPARQGRALTPSRRALDEISSASGPSHE